MTVVKVRQTNSLSTIHAKEALTAQKERKDTAGRREEETSTFSANTNLAVLSSAVALSHDDAAPGQP